MSVEAPIGGIQAPAAIAPAIPEPSLEGPVMPGAGKVSFETLSSMPQMEASLSASAEFSPKGLDGKIDFSQFSVIAQNNSLGEVSAPKDLVNFSAPKLELSPSSPEIYSTPSFNIEVPAFPGIQNQTNPLETVGEAFKSVIDEKIAKDPEFVSLEHAQAQKVEGLFVAVGIPLESAKIKIERILEDRGIDPLGTQKATGISVKTVEDHPIQEREEFGWQVSITEEETLIPSKTEPEKPKIEAKGKSENEEVEIDEEAHGARKNTLGRIIDQVSDGEEVEGKKVSERIEKTPDQISGIFDQLKINDQKDGSLEGVVNDISGIEILGETEFRIRAEQVLEENRPVKISQGRASKKAKDEEVEKVLGPLKSDAVLNKRSA